MSTNHSAAFTIAFGILAILLLFVVGFYVQSLPIMAFAVLTAAASYVSQWLATLGLSFMDRAFGPEVKDDERFASFMGKTTWLLKLARMVNALAAILFFAGLVNFLLIVAYVDTI